MGFYSFHFTLSHVYSNRQGVSTILKKNRGGDLGETPCPPTRSDLTKGGYARLKFLRQGGWGITPPLQK
jgi:hypothetical protein